LAVSVIEVPWQIVPDAELVILVGFTGAAITFTNREPEVVGFGKGQVALEVISQVMVLLPTARAVVVNVLELVPALTPPTFH
jgi:hypothetical protein